MSFSWSWDYAGYKIFSTILITPVNIWLTFLKWLSLLSCGYTFQYFILLKREKAAIFSECQFCRLQKPLFFFNFYAKSLCGFTNNISSLLPNGPKTSSEAWAPHTFWVLETSLDPYRRSALTVFLRLPSWCGV